MINIYQYAAAFIICALVAVQGSALYAQDKDILDGSNHPVSTEHSSVFSTPILPLDQRLSWKNRFNGDENFNENEALPKLLNSVNDEGGGISEGQPMLVEIDATGIIQSIKLSQGKIKLKHGPIARLGMPAMSMVFKVKNTEELQGLQKGQEVSFAVDNASGGFVLTKIFPMDEAAKSGQPTTEQRIDGQGLIKSIRAAQGKVKIKHGPIERLGMPAMTMMFKLKDSTMLNGLDEGMEVEFAVDNTGGGFVITHVKPKQ